MSAENESRQSSYSITDVIEELEELESIVSSPEEQTAVRETRQMLKRVPGGSYIRKYTSRDIAEGFIGGIIFSLPLLVEDGVFDIASWFVSVTFGGVPIMLVGNVIFICLLVFGLLYYTDFRTIVRRPILGIFPRRLVAVLLISLTVASLTMFLWGRLHENDPSRLEQVARITVLWTAAALGATLGDIIPGESHGSDLGTRLRNE